MRPLAALLSLAFLLAGCSGGGGDEGGPTVATSSASGTVTGPPPPVPRTDTLHLLEGPMMTPVPPTGGSDVRTPVGFAGGGGPGGGQQGPTARWQYQVTEPTNVTGGEVRIWVEVKEQMLPAPFNPAAPPCTWQLTTRIGGGSEPLVNCANEPAGPIAPGIRELTFMLVLQGPISLEANETVTVTLGRTAFSASTNNAVDALSGSTEHDSRIQLRGLKEPLTG